MVRGDGIFMAPADRCALTRDVMGAKAVIVTTRPAHARSDRVLDASDLAVRCSGAACRTLLVVGPLANGGAGD